MTAEIGVFPNSGHHYEFVPLPETIETECPDLREACVQDREPWRQHPDHAWIVYRLGVQADGTRGLWIAIESNLGGPDRGLVYEPRRPCRDAPVPEGHDPNKTPYAHRDPNELGGLEPLRVSIPIKRPNGEGEISIPLRPIVWMQRAADEPVMVDLVVDFGNTRTVALLLENDQEPRPMPEVCRPVRFMPRAVGYRPFVSNASSDDPYAIVDSWIVMHEAMFSAFWPPGPDFRPILHCEIVERQTNRFLRAPVTKRVVQAETSYIPQMFVEMAPVLLGGGNGKDSARQTLNDAQLEYDGNFFLSSPKRYAWDGKPMGVGGRQFWHIELNRWNPRKYQDYRAELPELNGPILMFMDPDGRDWEIDSPPNERPMFAERPHVDDHPRHPRRDSLTWVALNVLETAYRQMSSQEYRTATGRPYVPRKLRSVLVTFPSGWTSEELANYRSQWQKAINIFTLSHLRDRRDQVAGGDRPRLITDLDEAVASQLPLIYSEMTRLRGGENWIELVGRGVGSQAKVRVMNVDIGGGTTDISIVDYRDSLAGPQISLEATVVFKNSSTVAGDTLVKRVIENVLLPKMGAVFDGHERCDELRRIFGQIFRNTPEELRASEKAYRQKLGRVVRLVFIPIVNYWLSELGKLASGRTTDWETKAIEDLCAADESKIVQVAQLEYFNKLAQRVLNDSSLELLPRNQPFPPDTARLKQCVSDVFGHMFQVLGSVASAFECDLVLVSGKPSELPDVQDLLLRHLPLMPQRILFSHGFPVGAWYPVGASDGRIRDAKTPTVVGAALAQAMRGAKVRDWRLVTQRHFLLNENYWGVMSNAEIDLSFDSGVLLRPGESSCTSDMLLYARIGRKRYLSRYLAPDQIYVLDWKHGRERHETPLVRVTLERVASEDSTERLIMRHVEGVDENGRRIDSQDVELRLCTLGDGEFWMDNPQFEIGWNDG